MYSFTDLGMTHMAQEEEEGEEEEDLKGGWADSGVEEVCLLFVFS